MNMWKTVVASIYLLLAAFFENAFAAQTLITFAEFAPSGEEVVIDFQYEPLGVLFRAGVLIGSTDEIPNCKTIPTHLNNSIYLLPEPPGLRCRPIFNDESFPDVRIISRFVDSENPFARNIYARKVSFDLMIAVGSGATIRTFNATDQLTDSVSLQGGGLHRVMLNGIMHKITIDVPDGNAKFAIDNFSFELFKLIIEQPSNNQIFRLTNNNFRETDVFYKTNIMDRRVEFVNNIEYATSGNKGQISLPPPENFNGSPTDPIKRVYTAKGGKSTVNASLTDSGIKAVAKPVTFFIVGSAIPDADITARLVSLYAHGATPNLLTGIAAKESSYAQFTDRPLYGVAARWPTENDDGGSHIGLMQVKTTYDRAWDWHANTEEGRRLFMRDKLPAATRNERRIRNGDAKDNIPGHPGLRQLTDVELENMAVLLYGPCAPGPDARPDECPGARVTTLAEKVARQYYAPACQGGTIVQQHNDLLCQGGSWEWVVNTAGNSGGVKYVDSVRSKIIPK